MNRASKALFFSLISLSFLQNIVFAEWETGVSHNLVLKKSLSKDWYWISRNNLSSKSGYQNPFMGYFDYNLGRKLSGTWSADIGYRQYFLKLSNGWREEFRPQINLSWRKTEGKWTLGNRHRLEFRHFSSDEGDDHARYRNETRIEFPLTFTKHQLRPYFEEEFFYQFTDLGFHMNYMTLGLSFKAKSGVKVKFGYRWHTQKFGENWRNRHVFVTGLNLFF